MQTRLFAILLLVLSVPSLASAQSRPARRVGATVTWTVAGAGAGFGVGLWAGLTAFDDAINSDRKVWTTALVGAAVGGAGGFLISRALRSRRPMSPPRVGPGSTNVEHHD